MIIPSQFARSVEHLDIPLARAELERLQQKALELGVTPERLAELLVIEGLGRVYFPHTKEEVEKLKKETRGFLFLLIREFSKYQWHTVRSFFRRIGLGR